MHGRVFSYAVAALRIKITAACFQTAFPTSCKTNMTTSLKHVFVVWLWPVTMLRNNFLPRTAKHASEHENENSARRKFLMVENPL
jgi:hypothetical protein